MTIPSITIFILCVVIGGVIGGFNDVTETSNQSAERKQTVQRGESPFQSPGLVFLREQLQHGDTMIKERLDERYDNVKEQLKEGDALLKEQLTEGFARVKEQLKEGDNQLKEQLTEEEDWLKGKLTREEEQTKEQLKETNDRTKEQLTKQQTTIDGLKQQLEEWMTKNSGAVELMRQEVSELKSQLQVTRTSLQDTRDKLTGARNDLQTTQETLKTATDNLQTTQQALEATKGELKTVQKELSRSQENASHTADILETMKTEMTSMKMAAGEKNKMERYDTESSSEVLRSGDKIGSTFVRWGRTTCGNSSELVYAGVTGGSWYNHKGGSPTHLCLTMTPEADPKGTTVPPSLAYLYGAEYDGFPANAPQDAPCAVCLSRGTATVMVPGALTCPEGWTEQYTGLLVSGYHDHPRGSDTVCLDAEYELRDGGHVDHNGDLFYYLVTQCGSLPCPPYQQAQLVTCVVCSL